MTNEIWNEPIKLVEMKHIITEMKSSVDGPIADYSQRKMK